MVSIFFRSSSVKLFKFNLLYNTIFLLTTVPLTMRRKICSSRQFVKKYLLKNNRCLPNNNNCLYMYNVHVRVTYFINNKTIQFLTSNLYQMDLMLLLRLFIYFEMEILYGILVSRKSQNDKLVFNWNTLAKLLG